MKNSLDKMAYKLYKQLKKGKVIPFKFGILTNAILKKIQKFSQEDKDKRYGR